MQRTGAKRDHVQRARAFGGVGRWTAAKRELVAALAEDPGDVDVAAWLEMARAHTREVPVAEAEARLRALADEHPGRAAPRWAAAMLSGWGDPPAALPELRELATQFPEDGSIPAIICSFAQNDPKEAWAAFQRAVELGTGGTRTTRLVAYRSSRRLGQDRAGRRLVLDHASPLEQIAIRTFGRKQTPQILVWASWLAWAGAGILLGRGRSWSGVLVCILALILPAWLVFASLYICRSRRCVERELRAAPVVFVLPIGLTWMTYLLETARPGWALAVAIGWGALAGAYMKLVGKQRTPAVAAAMSPHA